MLNRCFEQEIDKNICEQAFAKTDDMSKSPLTRKDKQILKTNLRLRIVNVCLVTGVFLVACLVLFLGFFYSTDPYRNDFVEALVLFGALGLGPFLIVLLPAVMKTYRDLQHGTKHKCQGCVYKVRNQYAPPRSVYPIERWIIWLRVGDQSYKLNAPYWLKDEPLYNIKRKNRKKDRFVRNANLYMNTVVEVEYARFSKTILHLKTLPE